MGFKVKRTSPPIRALNVPLGVAWDGEGPVIPHRHLFMPDGRQLVYAGPWHMDGHLDGATWNTSNGLRVGATISEELPALGPLLQVSMRYLSRDPSWREITAVKDVFFGPGLDAMIMLPKEAHFVHGYAGNEDSHIYHIWQLPPTWERDLWP